MNLKRIEKLVNETNSLINIKKTYEKLANKIAKGECEDLQICFKYKDLNKRNKIKVIGDDGSLTSEAGGTQSSSDNWIVISYDGCTSSKKKEDSKTEFSQYFSQDNYIKFVMETIKDLDTLIEKNKNKLQKLTA